MGNLILSSTTMQEWDIETILQRPKSQSKDWDIETILQYESDHQIGPCCNGLTYLEIEQLNNTLYAK